MRFFGLASGSRRTPSSNRKFDSRQWIEIRSHPHDQIGRQVRFLDGVVLASSAAFFLYCASIALVSGRGASPDPESQAHAKCHSPPGLPISPQYERQIALRYECLSLPERQKLGATFLRQYAEMLDSIATLAFEAGMFEQVTNLTETARVRPSCKCFPDELLLRRMTVTEFGSVVHILELDQSRFPEVWEAYAEAVWVRSNIVGVEAVPSHTGMLR